MLVLSMYDDERYTRAALEAGAGGYVSKQAGAATLLAAIRALHAGDRFVAPGELAEGEAPELSTREREVMRLRHQGHAAPGGG